MSPALRLEAKLHREIPLAAAMELRVLEASAASVRVAVPLAPNRNHQQTAFGGSLHALGLFAGWSLLQLALDDPRFKVDYVVVQNSSMDYLAPARGAFEAHAQWDASRLAEFHSTLSRKGKARVELEVDLHSGGQLVARLRGRFVAQGAVTSVR